MIEFLVRSAKASEMLDITSHVQSAVMKAKVSNGMCLVFVPHTTAGIMINEGHDPAVASDILGALEKTAPRRSLYSHAEGNSDAHIKAAITGASASIIVKDGKLVLGTWQKVLFCEFDGPRERNIFVEVIEKT